MISHIQYAVPQNPSEPFGRVCEQVVDSPVFIANFSKNLIEHVLLNLQKLNGIRTDRI